MAFEKNRKYVYFKELSILDSHYGTLFQFPLGFIFGQCVGSVHIYHGEEFGWIQIVVEIPVFKKICEGGEGSDANHTLSYYLTIVYLHSDKWIEDSCPLVGSISQWLLLFFFLLLLLFLLLLYVWLLIMRSRVRSPTLSQILNVDEVWNGVHPASWGQMGSYFIEK